MTIFAKIFAILTLSVFWGGFVFMLIYSLKLKSNKDEPEEPKTAN